MIWTSSVGDGSSDRSIHDLVVAELLDVIVVKSVSSSLGLREVSIHLELFGREGAGQGIDHRCGDMSLRMVSSSHELEEERAKDEGTDGDSDISPSLRVEVRELFELTMDDKELVVHGLGELEI